MNLICSIFISVFFFVAAGDAFAKEECYYNPDVISYKYFLGHTGFTDARWDQLRKEARITLEKENEEVLVRYVACETFGMSAQLRMRKSAKKLDPGFLLGKIKWLGKNTLDSFDYGLMVKAISQKEFVDDLRDIVRKERVFVGVEDTDYQSFAVYVVSDKDECYVEISWYM